MKEKLFKIGDWVMSNEIVLFETGYKKILCKRTGITTDELSKGKIFKLIRIDTGKEYNISDQFVN